MAYRHRKPRTARSGCDRSAWGTRSLRFWMRHVPAISYVYWQSDLHDGHTLAAISIRVSMRGEAQREWEGGPLHQRMRTGMCVGRATRLVFIIQASCITLVNGPLRLPANVRGVEATSDLNAWLACSRMIGLVCWPPLLCSVVSRHMSPLVAFPGLALLGHALLWVCPRSPLRVLVRVSRPPLPFVFFFL